VTVEEIAADAGYSKRSIYLYFGDKRDLFEHALARELARWNDRLRSLERRESNALVLLEEILNDCFDHVAREDGLLRHLLEHWTLSVSTEARRRPPPGGSGSRIEARFDDLLRTFVLCLDRGAIDGTLPLYVDPLAEARWIWSQLVGAVLTPPRNATERSEMVTTWRREASRRIVAALATR
jgi:AcrR family transcriptional regulator